MEPTKKEHMKAYPASAIDCVLSLEQYLAHPTAKISRAAMDEVAAIRKKLGF